MLKPGGRFFCLEFSHVVLPMLDRSTRSIPTPCCRRWAASSPATSPPTATWSRASGGFRRKPNSRDGSRPRGSGSPAAAISPAESRRSIPPGGSRGAPVLRSLRNILRLLVIARVLARHGALRALASALAAIGAHSLFLDLARFLFGRGVGSGRPGERLAAALSELGPAFIKLGQVLSTRTDLLGAQVAADLSTVAGPLPPFSGAARARHDRGRAGRPVRRALRAVRRPAGLRRLDRPGAFRGAGTTSMEGRHGLPAREVAVKILRPGIERAFRRDLDLSALARRDRRGDAAAAAALPAGRGDRGLRAHGRVEMDLRLEAAARGELGAEFRRRSDLSRAADRLAAHRAPRADPGAHRRHPHGRPRPCSRRRATTSARCSTTAAAIFFRQAFRDGFFHGDQHPGNMVVDDEGASAPSISASWAGLDRPTRDYLADMLLGFLQRDYQRLADVHFAAGYRARRPVARRASPRPCARSASRCSAGRSTEISFARCSASCSSSPATFEMEVQPQSAAAAEEHADGGGRQPAARSRAQHLDAGATLIEQWMRENRGPEARVAEAWRARPLRRRATAAAAGSPGGSGARRRRRPKPAPHRLSARQRRHALVGRRRALVACCSADSRSCGGFWRRRRARFDPPVEGRASGLSDTAMSRCRIHRCSRRPGTCATSEGAIILQ